MLETLLRKPILICGLLLALAACKSPEEQAESYFESAKTLIAQGDTDRAVVELRNVFEFVPNHVEARLTLARLMMDAEEYSAAYGQYLRLVEQVPDNFEGRIALAEIAFNGRNWQEFNRHGSAAVELNPDDNRSKAVDLGLRYRSAIEEEDRPKAEGTIAAAETLFATLPQNTILLQIRMDGYVRAGEYAKALGQLNELIANFPDERPYYDQRITLLGRIGDMAAVEDGLRAVIAQFPDDLPAKSNLVQFLISRQELNKAEAFLREISNPAAEDPGFFIDLIRFVINVRGVEAGRTEIETAIAANPNPDRFRAMAATLDFSAGDQEGALATMEDILDGAEPSEQINDIKILLANMLVTRNNEVGAQRLVDEVLNDDSNHVASLKMKAAWQIQADQIDPAIANLRLALDNDPEDVQAMNLMSDAYTRAGSHDLSRDFMALAVEASGNAPEQALRYASVLANEESYRAAEDVLITALRQQPGNVDVLNQLGDLYLRMEDYGRISQVIDTLRRVDTQPAKDSANRLEVVVLNEREGTEQALAFIEDAAEADDATLNTRLSLIRARLTANEYESALELAKELAAEDPENIRTQVVLAAVQMALGNSTEAEDLYRAVLEKSPSLPTVWVNLSRVVMRQGRTQEAQTVLEDANKTAPGNFTILWAYASFLEREKQYDAAIAVYEELYSINSGSLVAANNLASLLTNYSLNPDNLERAWVIARRLRGTEVPHFQDTYGRIAFLRGEVDEALPYLENAAQLLQDDPIVQFHLAEVYDALKRPEDALEQYRKTIATAGPGDVRSEITKAGEAITRLGQQTPSE